MNTLVIVETFLAFVIAITLHEAAHAGMAWLLGDGSSWAAGRLSVNPRRQMAAIGSIVAVTLSFGIPLGGCLWAWAGVNRSRSMRGVCGWGQTLACSSWRWPGQSSVC